MKIHLSDYYFGLIAEYIIIFFYKIRFYKILSHRMRNKYGEIDLIASKGDNLVFIEVKARRGTVDYTNIVSYKQQQRIQNAARLFLYSNPQYNMRKCRFDLAIVQNFTIPEIIQNAW
jgi:putative endonuclease